MNFEDRLTFLIKDRKKTPWGKSLGFTSPSITAMFNGHVPGPEFLQAIGRAENVNLNWLLTGEGSPYSVEYFPSAEAIACHVRTMLEEEQWVVHIVSYQNIACLALTQPGQYEFKGKWIDYRIVHIITGPGDESLTDVLHDYHQRRGAIFVPVLTEEERDAIISGKVGTYELLGQMNPMLNTIRVEGHVSDIEFTNAERSEKPINISIMRAVVRLVDECELEIQTKLTSEERSRVITAVYRQAERLNLSEADIQSVIETSFDVLSD